MEWLIKKRKAFDQRGEMEIAAWAEQQQREMNLRARRLSQSKVNKTLMLGNTLDYHFRIPKKGLGVILHYLYI